MIADACSRGADERDPLGEEAASDEAENLLRRLVEPVRVVDDAGEGSLLRDLGQERQGREPDQESVRSRAGAEPEHGRERVALWLWKSFQLSEHRGADLVEAAVGELQLRLDTDGSHDAPAVEPIRQVAEECALPDAGFAAKDQDTAVAGERLRQEPLERDALGSASEEPCFPSRGVNGIPGRSCPIGHLPPPGGPARARS